MTSSDKSEDQSNLSVEGMRDWLKREIADVSRARDLRVSEATGFVEAYAKGTLSQEELLNRTYEYSCRWGEALPGVGRSEGLTDEQILNKINLARIKQGELDPAAIRKRKGDATHSR